MLLLTARGKICLFLLVATTCNALQAFTTDSCVVGCWCWVLVLLLLVLVVGWQGYRYVRYSSKIDILIPKGRHHPLLTDHQTNTDADKPWP